MGLFDGNYLNGDSGGFLFSEPASTDWYTNTPSYPVDLNWYDTADTMQGVDNSGFGYDSPDDMTAAAMGIDTPTYLANQDLFDQAASWQANTAEWSPEQVQGYYDASPAAGGNWWNTVGNAVTGLGGLAKGAGSAVINGGKTLAGGLGNLNANDTAGLGWLGTLLGAGVGLYGKQQDKEAQQANTEQIRAELSQIHPTALGPFDPTAYMNPYTDQVLTPELNRFDEMLANGVFKTRANAIANGNGWGSRANLQEGQALERGALARNEIANKAYQQGFDTSADLGLKVRAQDLLGQKSAADVALGKVNALNGLPATTSTASDIGSTLATLGGIGLNTAGRMNQTGLGG